MPFNIKDLFNLKIVFMIKSITYVMQFFFFNNNNDKHDQYKKNFKD